IILWLLPASLDVRVDVSTPAVILAGLLVGIGTRIGNGCTSGHGVAGVGRLAPRSIVASLVFVASAMLTVYVVRHVLGG
ncbi:MAG: YeeE/YedE family protein, partial [Gammaproteobacteria bacterium]